MITPTPGRIVWYHPAPSEDVPRGKDPLAAIIVLVHNDREVNLAVFDGRGKISSRTSVRLLQNGETGAAPYAEWMPYQKGQAAKTEQAEKQAARKIA